MTQQEQAGALREIRIKKRFGHGKRGCGKKTNIKHTSVEGGAKGIKGAWPSEWLKIETGDKNGVKNRYNSPLSELQV